MRIRTADLVITNHLLYQLSYGGILVLRAKFKGISPLNQPYFYARFAKLAIEMQNGLPQSRFVLA